MTRRMSGHARREQLLEIMYRHHEKAAGQGDFSASLIAAEASVSAVLVYNLVGQKFKELRARLPGKRRPPSTINGELRREIRRLEALLKELREKYEAAIKGEIAEAIRLIELLEEENTMLRSLLRAGDDHVPDEGN